jgi:phage terminase small subunit
LDSLTTNRYGCPREDCKLEGFFIATKKEVSAIATKEKALTAKEKAFVGAYRVCRNATQAAIQAGYSKRTASVIGYENLKKPHIQKELAKFEQEDAVRNKVNVDLIFEILLREANRDPTESSGSSRVRAAELLGKQIGMWNEQPKDDNVFADFVDALKQVKP